MTSKKNEYSLEYSHELLQILMGSLAEVTSASFLAPAQAQAQALNQPQSSDAVAQQPRATAPTRSPSTSPLENPKMVEALLQLQKRRSQTQRSPRVINSHFRPTSAWSETGLEKAKIYFPRKPHG